MAEPTEPAEFATQIWGPEDLLALIPYTLGFHPDNSLVMACADQHGRNSMTLRLDLPEPEQPSAFLAPLADETAAILTREKQTTVYLVAYTARAELALPLVRELLRAFDTAGIAVGDTLRAAPGRYWSLLCDDQGCCPAEGKPLDLASNRITAESVVAGQTAFASEDELRESISPQTGLARAVMDGVTREAVAALADCYLPAPDPARAFRGDGAAYVTAVVSRYLTRGGRLANEEAARASIYLADLEVRDQVWLDVRHEVAPQLVEFWRDLTRRAVPPYDAAPNALLAFSAWLAGQAALARLAVNQLRANHPDYGLGRLVGDLLRFAVPTSLWAPEEFSKAAAQADLGLLTDPPAPAPKPSDQSAPADGAGPTQSAEGDDPR